MSRLTLYADYGCPYAHRVLALLAAIDVPFELHQSSLGSKPAGVLKFSATEQIPLLVAGELVLTESRVMLEYLAERYGYETGWPDTAAGRARHRLGMALVDRFIAPVLRSPIEDVDRTRFIESMRSLADIVEGAAPDSLLGFHAAPMWLHLRTGAANSEVVRRIRAEPRLHDWLDSTVATPYVSQTSPDFVRVRREVAGYLGAMSS